MKEKKTEVITFRTDKETKKILELIANEKDWTVAQTVHNIIKKYIEKSEEVT